jgi:SAM-dependent methyltransferase
MSVHVTEAQLRLPDEIDQALGRPSRIRVHASPDGFMITSAGLVEVPKDWLRKMLSRPAGRLARRSRGGFDVRRAIPDGVYGVASHHPSYFLMLRDDDPSEGRERYWSSIADYHEHRAPTVQDAGARTETESFVSEWLLPTGGSSFLELGCGAGRNLVELRRLSDVGLYGLDTNAGSLGVAAEAVPGAALMHGSLYDLSGYKDNSVDVVFTAGVLMHIPHEKVAGIVAEMRRIARLAVVHSELHGDSRPYDFHRYPRDYGALYEAIGLPYRYVVEPLTDGTSGDRGLLSADVSQRTLGSLGS